jgi:hypothetical protein
MLGLAERDDGGFEIRGRGAIALPGIAAVSLVRTASAGDECSYPTGKDTGAHLHGGSFRRIDGDEAARRVPSPGVSGVRRPLSGHRET